MTGTLQPMPLTEQQHIVLEDVSWSLYEKLLEEVGNRPLRLTFDQGRLEIMAPLPLHEKWKKRLGRLIETLSLELYAALGVPEFWRFDGRTLTVLRLDADGRYRPAPASGVFPFLPWDRFQSFVDRLKTEEQTAVLRDVRDWVQTLNP